MAKTIKIKDDLYNYLRRRSRGKESFDQTLRRLLRFRGDGQKGKQSGPPLPLGKLPGEEAPADTHLPK